MIILEIACTSSPATSKSCSETATVSWLARALQSEINHNGWSLAINSVEVKQSGDVHLLGLFTSQNELPKQLKLPPFF